MSLCILLGKPASFLSVDGSVFVHLIVMLFSYGGVSAQG